MDTLLLGTIRQLTEFGSILSFPLSVGGWGPNVEHEVERAFLATHIAHQPCFPMYVTKLINSGQIRSCMLPRLLPRQLYKSKRNKNRLVYEMNKRSPCVHGNPPIQCLSKVEKAPLHLCCRKGQLSCLDACLSVKKTIFGWIAFKRGSTVQGYSNCHDN